MEMVDYSHASSSFTTMDPVIFEEAATMTAALQDVVVMLDSAPALSPDSGLCPRYETYTLYRFIYIMISTLVSVGGCFCNVLLIILFAKRSCATTAPSLYPSALAVLDAVICGSYMLLFGVDAIISYLRIESLFTLYYIYIIPAFTLARIAQISIPYMLIFATLERLVWISDRRSHTMLRRLYSREGRYATLAITLLVCALVKLPSAWALEVTVYPHCPDFFRTLTTEPAAWTEDNWLWHFFDFEVLTIAQTVVPFVLLVIFNVIIVRKLRAVSADIAKHDGGSPLEVTIHSPTKSADYEVAVPFKPVDPPQKRSTHSQVRSAILTMVAIVISYLACNSLQLILTIFERSGSDILIDSEDPDKSSIFHTSFSDLISFVYMFTSAIRLFIYAACNNEIRRDLLAMIGSPRPSNI